MSALESQNEQPVPKMTLLSDGATDAVTVASKRTAPAAVSESSVVIFKVSEKKHVPVWVSALVILAALAIATGYVLFPTYQENQLRVRTQLYASTILRVTAEVPDEALSGFWAATQAPASDAIQLFFVLQLENQTCAYPIAAFGSTVECAELSGIPTTFTIDAGQLRVTREHLEMRFTIPDEKLFRKTAQRATASAAFLTKLQETAVTQSSPDDAESVSDVETP